jgi:transcriptional regulator with XRE-family HTH domain
MERLPADMDFSKRLVATRKERGMTQEALAQTAGLNVSQIRRYEGGSSQPSLEALRKLAVALSVSADELLFEDHERDPEEKLRLQFEAVSRLDSREQEIAMEVLDGLLLKHDARRWTAREKTG